MPPRRGTTLLELVVTATLLGTAFVTVLPVLHWAAIQRRDADQRLVALQEAGNVLERVSLHPWESLTAESLAGFEVSAAARGRLREPRLNVSVAECDDPLPARRITVELGWTDRAGVAVTPVRLTTWRFSREGTP